MSKYTYGWKKDRPDHRDLHYHLIVPCAGDVPLPPSADLRPFMPPVYDQGNLGSCTGNGTGAALHAVLLSKGIKDLTPARLFLYYNARDLEGTPTEDSGAQIRDVVKRAAALGFCPENQRGSEASWPYDIARFAVKPPDACYRDAKRYHIGTYLSVAQSDYQLKNCLAISCWPIICGFSVPDTFEGDAMAKTGRMPLSDWQSQNFVGGHCVLLVGYDDTAGEYVFRNSWGEGWGDKGYFSVPQQLVSGDDLGFSDFWTIQGLTIAQ